MYYSETDTVIYITGAQEEICAFFQAEMRPLLCDTPTRRHDASGRAAFLIARRQDASGHAAFLIARRHDAPLPYSHAVTTGLFKVTRHDAPSSAGLLTRSDNRGPHAAHINI